MSQEWKPPALSMAPALPLPLSVAPAPALRLSVAAGHDTSPAARTGLQGDWNALGTLSRRQGNSGQCGARYPCDPERAFRGSNGAFTL